MGLSNSLLLDEKLLHEKFFFAEDDAEYYDDTIELTVPYYQVVHKTMIDILNYHFGVIYGEKFRNVKGIILDVGAGTGKESISVLNNFPNLSTLAVDLCAPMKSIYERNYAAKFGTKAAKRYKYFIEDIMVISDKDKEVRRYFDSKKQNGCKAAISAYCIHHFILQEKKEIYRKMYDFLEPGGILINMDLFNYESEPVKLQAHYMDIEYIKKEFDNPSPQFKNSKKISLKKRKLLKEKWVHHMNNDNILDSVESQIMLLKDIGFEEVECVFKYWQQGVIRAKKPAK